MNDQKLPVTELIFTALGEAAASALTVAVYLILGKYDHTVLCGVLLGSAVILLNFIILSIAINRAADNILAEVSGAAMDDVEAAKFAAEHRGRLNKVIRLSNSVRTLSIVSVLVAAFLIGHFDVIATLIPIAAFRPLLMLAGLVSGKGKKLWT